MWQQRERELRQQKAKLAMFHIKVHIKSETIITHDQEQYQEQEKETRHELQGTRPGNAPWHTKNIINRDRRPWKAARSPPPPTPLRLSLSPHAATMLPLCNQRVATLPRLPPPLQVNVTIAAVASVAQPLGSTCTNYTVLNIKYSNNIYETLTRASLMVTPPSPLVCVCVGGVTVGCVARRWFQGSALCGPRLMAQRAS